MMTSRRYIKRIWRVPKHRGATEYFATLVVKALVKHGWPAKWAGHEAGGFDIYHVDHGLGGHLPEDFLAAVAIAVRIAARTYRVDVFEDRGAVLWNRDYRVAPGGHFREIKE